MRICLAVFLYAFVCCRMGAEATRLPFFPVAPVFSSEPEFFSHLSGWVSLDQSLDQDTYPDTGHCYECGLIYTFFSSRKFSVSGLAREMFRFQAHPDSDFYFYPHDLVTDFRLYGAYNAGILDFIAGYHHDCKHDIGTFIRTAIHDTLFLQTIVPSFELPLKKGFFQPRTQLDFEAEANIKAIFQDAPEEPDKGRLSAECEFIPFSFFSDVLYLFMDMRGSCIFRKTDKDIPADPVNFDGILRAGADYRIGKGDIRLFYYYERITDNWATMTPSTEYISAIQFLMSIGI